MPLCRAVRDRALGAALSAIRQRLLVNRGWLRNGGLPCVQSDWLGQLGVCFRLPVRFAPYGASLDLRLAGSSVVAVSLRVPPRPPVHGRHGVGLLWSGHGGRARLPGPPDGYRPRLAKSSGSRHGMVGLFSYLVAGVQDTLSGCLLDM